ncbi:MAG: hypothetical protein ACM31D_16985 [Bacteroidota bacterium]
MMNLRIPLLCILLSGVLAAPAVAEDQAPQSTASEVKEGVKEGARTVGHATRDATRAVGHATRDTAKAIGHGTRDAARETKSAVKKAWNDVVGKSSDQ